MSLNPSPNLNGMDIPEYVLKVRITDKEYNDTGTITIDIAVINSPAVFVNLPTQVNSYWLLKSMWALFIIYY